MLYKNHNPELFGNVPADLKSQNQWLLWSYVPHKDSTKKPRKMPRYVDGSPRKGDQNSKEQKSRLTNFEDATFGADLMDCGIGFQMLKDDGLVAVDLDDCIDQNGKLDEYSSSIIKDLPGYWEISPSGKGVRGFFKGSTKTRRNDKFEVYCGVQFLTVTGNALTNNRDLTEFKEVFGGVTETKNTTFEEEDWIPKPIGGDDWEIAKKALKHIDPDCEYPKWIEVAQSLQDGFGDDGLDLFLDWSRNGAKFTSDEEATAQYRKFRPGKGIRFASLIHSAKEGGMPAHEMRVTNENAPSFFQVQDNWRDRLKYAKTKGDEAKKLLRVKTNLSLILANDEDLPRFRFNEMSRYVEIDRKFPWKNSNRRFSGHYVSADMTSLLIWLEDKWGLVFGEDVVEKMVIAIADVNSYHPLIEKMENEIRGKWDGKPRMETWLIDNLGVSDTELVREMSKRFLSGALHRLYNPGCAIHTIPILEGIQGLGKTSVVKHLAMGFDGKLGREITNKDTIANMHRYWIVEISELTSLRKAQVEDFKDFVTKSFDDWRPPYARTNQSFDRSMVFMGTTNANDYLKDTTGNRRFWPLVLTKKIDHESFKKEVIQIWAEALEKYEAIDPFLPEKFEHLAAEEQKTRVQKDAWHDQIEEFLERKVPEDYLDRHDIAMADPKDCTHDRDYVYLPHIFNHLGIEVSRQSNADKLRIENVLRMLNWVPGKRHKLKNGTTPLFWGRYADRRRINSNK